MPKPTFDIITKIREKRSEKRENFAEVKKAREFFQFGIICEFSFISCVFFNSSVVSSMAKDRASVVGFCVFLVAQVR